MDSRGKGLISGSLNNILNDSINSTCIRKFHFYCAAARVMACHVLCQSVVPNLWVWMGSYVTWVACNSSTLKKEVPRLQQNVSCDNTLLLAVDGLYLTKSLICTF